MKLRIIERVGETCARRQYAVERQIGDGEYFVGWSLVQFFEHLDDAQFFMANYGNKVIAERVIDCEATGSPAIAAESDGAAS